MYPDMYRIRQTFEGPAVADIPATVQAELARVSVASVIKPGGRQSDGGLSQDDRR